MEKEVLEQYANLLGDIKTRIRQGQAKAVLAVNAELLAMYWDIGKIIHERQQRDGWGAAVIPRLSRDLHNDLPELKGFSERNIGRMISFYRQYPILPQAVAKSEMPNSMFQIPWGHHVLLIEKVKDLSTRFWYIQQSADNGWSRDVLAAMIKSDLHLRQSGNILDNFDATLPTSQSDLVRQMLKDPYIFDFMTLSESFDERELETALVKHLEKFLLELGAGFSFVGRQYQIEVGEREFYIDLLFYHLRLRCFVVIDLKKGEFKPEHAGKVNFYCAAVDDILRHPTDQPSIGLILCQDKNKIIAEYALRNVQTPIGVSAYEMTRALPEHIKSSLPSIEDLEAELSK